MNCFGQHVYGTLSNRINARTLQEYLQYTSGFLVDKTANTFDTASSGKTSDSWLSDSLDVVAQDFAVTFGTTSVNQISIDVNTTPARFYSLSESFSTFATASHDVE
jgi:hypothetical protein